jgi:hypothetical protein
MRYLISFNSWPIVLDRKLNELQTDLLHSDANPSSRRSKFNGVAQKIGKGPNELIVIAVAGQWQFLGVGRSLNGDILFRGDGLKKVDTFSNDVVTIE